MTRLPSASTADIDTVICPVSGLTIRSSPGWIYTQDDPFYQCSVNVIGDDIVYNRVKGFVTTDALRSVIPLVHRVIREAIGEGVPYAQIEDYRDLTRATFDARRFFIKDITAREDIAALICCNVSSLFKINIGLAMRVARYHFAVSVAEDYADALGRAEAALGRQWPPDDSRWAAEERFQVIERPPWHTVRLGDTAHAAISGLGEHILMSKVTAPRPLDATAAARWMDARRAALTDLLPDGGDVVDLLALQNSGLRVSLSQVTALAAAPLPEGYRDRGLVVFNAGIGLRAALFGQRLLCATPRSVDVAPDRVSAIELAAGRLTIGNPVPPPGARPPDRGYEYHRSERFEVRFDVVDGNILRGICIGAYGPEDVAPSMAAMTRAADRIAPGDAPLYIAVDVSRVTGTASRARRAHVSSLRQWLKERPRFRVHAFFGVGRPTRATITVLRPLIPIDVRIVPDFAAVRRMAGGRAGLSAPAIAVPETDVQPIIDQILSLLASVKWESDGLDPPMVPLGAHHPLAPVYDALTLIKGDLDDLSRDRNAAETERLILASAIEQSTDGVVISDRTGVVIYANPSFCRITGRTPAATIGQPLEIIHGTAPEPGAGRDLMETVAKGSIWRNLIVATSDDDRSPYRVDATVSPIMDGAGEIINYVATLRDVSHENELEMQLRQRRKMEAIGTLAGGIAHDFNNILFPIIGFAEMAQDQLADGHPAAESLEEILTAALRARELVQQILTFSRQKEIRRRPVAVTPIVQEALRFLRATLPATIKIEEHLSRDDPVVMADPTQIHQIIINLGTNALQAMRDTGGILSITMDVATALPENASAPGNGSTDGAYLHIQVTDTGTGIAPQDLDRVFDPFFTTRQPGEGTGMGLSITHGIVSAHDGTIRADSEPGMGTRMHVYLPVLTAGAEMPMQASTPRVRGNNDRLLILDDEPSIVRMLTGMLEKEGFRVSAHTRPSSALSAFEADPGSFSLVITDLTMPEMTGERVADAIDRMRPGMPVIICTGFRNMIKRLRSSEHREVLPKPVVKKELLTAIDRLRCQSDPYGADHAANSDH